MSTIYSSAVKRAIDVFAVLLLLFLLTPVLLVIILAYVLFMEFPLIYHQRRIGKSGQTFILFKFRTLKTDATQPLQQRRFAWGDFLRRFSLDELPQLWNVLKGDMSLIGPRPLPAEYAHLFSEKQWKRHLIRPGITGLAQINGRNSISWKQKFEYDLYYIQNLSAWMDTKIAFATIVMIFSLRKDVSLQERKFTGKE